MGAFYIDDSVHDEAGFIIGACVYCEEEIENEIKDVLIRHNQDPNNFEYKSSINYSKNQELIPIRDELKWMLIEKCKIGVVVLPRDKRQELGKTCLLAVKQFISSNNLVNVTDVYLDQGMFNPVEQAKRFIDALELDYIKFHIEQDSKAIRGIQLADLSAHLFAIKLKDAMGLIHKMVKVGDNSGYEPDTEIELGFEIFGAIRYCIFNRGSRVPNDDMVNDATVDVEPNGLYISELCNSDLAKYARYAFGSFYLGCVH